LVGSPDQGRAIAVGVPPTSGSWPGKEKQEDFQLLLDLSDSMIGKTICVVSDSCAAPVVSGIQKFRGEFEAYIAGACEPALVAV